MYSVREIPVVDRDPATLLDGLSPARADRLRSACRARRAGPRIWHVNSAADGGGVAELLRATLGYAQGLGVDVGWLVVEGPPEFFAVTKSIDNGVSGLSSDDPEITVEHTRRYDEASTALGDGLAQYVEPGDHVVLHDPQTTGLVAAARRAGAAVVVWRAHNGCDHENAATIAAWRFLLPRLAGASAVVTTLAHFAPRSLREAGITRAVITPCIDPQSLRNVPLDDVEVDELLAWAGVVGAPRSGAVGELAAAADVVRCGPGPGPESPVVVQVGRWDRVKDMDGTLAAFAAHVRADLDAHLVLAGPEVSGIADDPEAAVAYERCLAAWRAQGHDVRRRTQLVSLPMTDLDLNARVVNALQRRATVVTQKSLSEGFGLTATEAMWKATPVVLSEVGGLAHQARDCAATVDPHDHAGFGGLVEGLLADPARRERDGRRAAERVRAEFLPDTHIVRELELLDRCAVEAPDRAAPAGVRT